jgi:hypothetical protein
MRRGHETALTGSRYGEEGELSVALEGGVHVDVLLQSLLGRDHILNERAMVVG